MRNAKLLIPAVTLAALSSLSLAAQQQPGQPAPGMPPPSQTQPSAQPGTGAQPGSMPEQQTTPSQQGAAVPAPSTANAPEASNAELRPVTGELVSKLDTKNAKNGDQVVIKTTQKATFADGVEIPKGSKIMGHVTDVQAQDGNNPNSKVAIQFDQAELKGGQTMPIKSVLQSVEPASGSDAAQTSPMGAGSAPSAAPSSAAAGAPASPGSGSPTGSASSTAQAPMQGGSTAASPGAAAGASPSGYPAAGTVVAHQGNIQIKTTSIPGVLIAGNASGQPFANASGALIGARMNVHLDGGTKMTLAIANGNIKASNNR